MIDLYQLEQFVTIVEKGTMTKAAETLLISQPALSRSINKLEDELEVHLFDHTKNKLILNENGKFAYDKAKAILKQIDDFKTSLIDYDKDHFISRIGSCAPAPFWGVDAIFDEVYPHHQTTHVLFSDTNELINGLLNDQYTLIILNHRINNRSLRCIPFVKEILYLYVTPDSKYSDYDEISFEELNGESVLLSSKIGFWSELTKLNLPDSHLLYQSDETIIQELVNASNLPTFRTNITMAMNPNPSDRNCIPFSDSEATIQYFIYFKKSNSSKYDFIRDHIETINWPEEGEKVFNNRP